MPFSPSPWLGMMGMVGMMTWVSLPLTLWSPVSRSHWKMRIKKLPNCFWEGHCWWMLVAFLAALKLAQKAPWLGWFQEQLAALQREGARPRCPTRGHGETTIKCSQLLNDWVAKGLICFTDYPLVIEHSCRQSPYFQSENQLQTGHFA